MAIFAPVLMQGNTVRDRGSSRYCEQPFPTVSQNTCLDEISVSCGVTGGYYRER